MAFYIRAGYRFPDKIINLQTLDDLFNGVCDVDYNNY